MRDGAALLHIALPRLLLQREKALIHGEGLGVVLMRVEIQCQLVRHEAQRHYFRERRYLLSLVDHAHKRQVKPWEQRPAGERLH